ncbi:type II toxin-antitoxin system RelE/ParE family toxin [Nocardioides sp.]|uniref:type II toxin-antitoxin system RelE/ParE family toxin n=1 Tax=Nocardioides sp. TaxID=35761 RepID=UPI0039E4C5A1
MTWSVEVSVDALSDVDEAVAWYATEAPEQVERLLADFDVGGRKVGFHPLTRAEFLPGRRRVHLQTFPYELWYIVDEDEKRATVIAVVHDRQDDRQFLERQR